MMNVLALSFVVSSLAAAGVWSPAPQREDVIVKEGHRVIVVEYDEDGKHNTKVSISPTPPQNKQKPAEFEAETIKEAGGGALPNLGQGISPQGKATVSVGAGRHSAGELICDAYGKCTHKIAAAFGKAKDKVSETANDAKEKVEDKVSETAHGVKEKVQEKVSEAAHGVKEKVSETANEAKEKVIGAPKRWLSHEAKDRVVETADQTKEAVGDALGKAKETVAQKSQDVKEGAKNTVKAAKDSAKAAGDHTVTNVTEKVENAKEKAMEGAKEAKENTKKASKGVKTGANKFFDGLKYLTSVEALNSAMGMADLLGLATAYGMSIWVTFISSDILAGVLPRQQFGVVQSKIYPIYFRAMAYSIGLALLGHILGQRSRLLSSTPEKFQAFNLLSSLLMVLTNALYLEPKATKVMFERMKMEKEEGRGRDDFTGEGRRTSEAPLVSDSPAPTSSSEQELVVKSRMAKLNDRLKKLNTNSSLLNVLTLMALTWHLVYLGQRLGIHF